MTEKNTKLGRKVRVLRAKRQMSVRGLAAAAGVDATWLSRLERGMYDSPDPRLLRELAEVLEIEASELFIAAGFEDSQSLPQFAPYLRVKYDLPEDAVAQLEAHFKLFNKRPRKDGGHD
jgi:transcriptional regulator with XRE-family HTH domain